MAWVKPFGNSSLWYTILIGTLCMLSLYVNDNNTSFRSKVKSKFAPQVKNIQPLVNKDKEVAKPSFVLVIPPSIPAKLSKEVKEILKFFKKIKKPTINKLYAQALLSKPKSNVSPSDIVMNMLKIKEVFLNLPNKKIDSI